MHQAHFRRSTLAAYGQRCCVCELRERPLLDAAHIIPDRLPEGVPTVRNGMSMCSIHHRAYDRGILLITDEYVIDVRDRLLKHPEAPAAQQMLLDYRGREIRLPKRRDEQPDPEYLRAKLALAG